MESRADIDSLQARILLNTDQAHNEKPTLFYQFEAFTDRLLAQKIRVELISEHKEAQEGEQALSYCVYLKQEGQVVERLDWYDLLGAKQSESSASLTVFSFPLQKGYFQLKPHRKLTELALYFSPTAKPEDLRKPAIFF